MADLKPPFATLADLQARYPELAKDKETQAKVLIDDASQMIIDLVGNRTLRVPAETLTRVVCAMVIRALQAKPEMVGLSAFQMGAGPFQESRTFANPTGDLYLSKSEKKILGLTGGKAKFVSGFPSTWGPNREGL